MSDTHEDRRASGRRNMPRRTHDLLQDVVPEEDLQQYDRQQYGRHIGADRRTQERRSGEDRRAGGISLPQTLPLQHTSAADDDIGR